MVLMVDGQADQLRIAFAPDPINPTFVRPSTRRSFEVWYCMSFSFLVHSCYFIMLTKTTTNHRDRTDAEIRKSVVCAVFMYILICTAPDILCNCKP